MHFTHILVLDQPGSALLCLGYDQQIKPRRPPLYRRAGRPPFAAYIDGPQLPPQPFRWTKTATDDILASIERFVTRTIAVPPMWIELLFRDTRSRRKKSTFSLFRHQGG